MYHLWFLRITYLHWILPSRRIVWRQWHLQQFAGVHQPWIGRTEQLILHWMYKVISCKGDKTCSTNVLFHCITSDQKYNEKTTHVQEVGWQIRCVVKVLAPSDAQEETSERAWIAQHGHGCRTRTPKYIFREYLCMFVQMFEVLLVFILDSD